MKVDLNELRNQKIIRRYSVIEDELDRAKEKHPEWPENMCKQFVIVQEELGEVAKAVLHYQDEEGSLQDIKDELIQTAAMCARMLERLGDF